jgi:hypothetical protein
MIVMGRIRLGGEDYIPTTMLTSFIPYVRDEGTQVVKQDPEYYSNDFNK